MSASLSGILMTFLVLGVLITIHELGHFLAAKSIKVPVRQFAIGFGPRLLGFQWGETECRLNVLPLGGYCAFADDVDGEQPIPPEQLLRSRPIWQRTWVISAGVLFNFVSAWFLLFGSNVGLGIPTNNQIVSIRRVLPETPAQQSGLQVGDRLLRLAGESIHDFGGFRERLADFKNKPVVITIERAGQTRDLTATPTDKGTLGFSPSIRPERVPAASLGAIFAATNEQQYRYTTMLASALYQLFTQPAGMMDKTGGPVAIVAMGDQVYQDDPWLLLEFAVILSIELALINLLPLPALDGGHLVMLALEKLRGKPLPRALEERILVTGFTLLLGLGVMLIIKDLFTVPDMYRQSAPPVAPSTTKP